MKSTHFNLIIIGSGPGGYTAALLAAQMGLQVALVEQQAIGGTCLNWGCIPTHALLESAYVWKVVQEAQLHGIQVEQAKVDFASVIKRSRALVDRLKGGLEQQLKQYGIHMLQGRGRLVTHETVEVIDVEGLAQQYTAEHIILATGAQPRILPQLPLDREYVLSYQEALNLEKRPQNLLVVGAGAFGVELAYFYQAMGSQVTLIQDTAQVLPHLDAEITAFVQKSLTHMGVEVLTQTAVEALKKKEKGVCEVLLQGTGGIKQGTYDRVIVAAGRVPNATTTGIVELGVKLVDGYVPVNSYYQTNMQRVYAVGDVIPGPAFAHVASAEAEICVKHLAGKVVDPLDYQNIPICMYSHPEVAAVGHTEADAKAMGYALRIGRASFSTSGKAQILGEEGFVKVLFDAEKGTWLGAHMVGTGVTELISEVVVARQLEATAQDILHSVHPHPTLSELIRAAIFDAYRGA